jgi:hypothetical protein
VQEEVVAVQEGNLKKKSSKIDSLRIYPGAVWSWEYNSGQRKIVKGKIGELTVTKRFSKAFLIFIIISIFFIFTANLLLAQERFEVEDITFTLKSPNGYDLNVRSVRPKLSIYPNKKFPAVLKLAGGWGTMTKLLNGEMIRKAVSKGIIFVAFNSPIRVSPDSAEASRGDYKGFKEQADVAEVLKYIVESSNVSLNAIGIWSHSSGAILAAGVLGRYPELSEKIAFFIDNEGPHCAKDLLEDPSINAGAIKGLEMWKKARDAKVGRGKQYKTEEEFWYERCGNNFIGNYKGVYQRIQAKNDHALGSYYQHAIAYLNAATGGRAEWTRLNRQPKDQIYKSEQFPNGIPIETALDIESLRADSKVGWHVLFKLLEEVQK